MNYNYSEINFPSSDGIHSVNAEIYTPKSKTSRGIVQLAHGMVDHVSRYRELADCLTGEGYIFAGNHHLGHGKTASEPEELGFFAEKGGVDFVLRDMHSMNRHLRAEFPTLPLILMGHSMGSFLARLYINKYRHSVKGAIIHGTAGPNGAAGMGIALSSLIIGLRGPKHKSKLLDKLTTGSYNKSFDKSEGSTAWLSRDSEALSGHDDDIYSNFKFTASGHRDLMRMLRDCNRKEWFAEYPKRLPTLIISGSADPVGNFGKGPEYVYKHLMISGCEKLEIKMYEGARHELFLETNREAVFKDITEWLDRTVKETHI